MWKRMTDLIDPQNSGTQFSDKPTFKSLGATDKNDTKGGTGSLWRINFNPSVPWFSDVASMDTKILRKRKKEIWKPLFAQIRSKRFFWCPLSFNNSKIQQSLPQAQYDRHPRLPSCLSPTKYFNKPSALARPNYWVRPQLVSWPELLESFGIAVVFPQFSRPSLGFHWP